MDGKTNGGVFAPQNLTLYGYSFNNPINLVDPDGESPTQTLEFGKQLFQQPNTYAKAAGVAVVIYAVGALAYEGIAHYIHGEEAADETQAPPPANLGSQTAPPPPPSMPDPDDDEYENPGHHDPSGGPDNYNKTKSVLPKNHKELWKSSKVSKHSKHRWSKEGSGKKATYHRFSNNGNGKYHWSGSVCYLAVVLSFILVCVGVCIPIGDDGYEKSLFLTDKAVSTV